jgi:acyl-CoA synthetase (AMP-forming)/AMP-acid ligase II
MEQRQSTFTSHATQELLRRDTSLGSGNLLARCSRVHASQDVEFLSLEQPITLPNGHGYRAFSLETLLEAQRCLAGWYLARGAKRGDVIALCLSDGIGPFLHYSALSSLGAAAAPINPAMPVEIAVAYMRENELNWLVQDQETAERTGLSARLAGSGVRCDLIDRPGAVEPIASLGSTWPEEPDDSTLVMLSHTSGTTGVPKAVRFEHRQFFMGKRARIGQFAESAEERILSALPQSHSSAISHLETAILHGIPTLVLGNSTGAPVRRALHDFAPTIVLGFPQTYTSLIREGIAPNEFPSVRRWFSMGDAAHEGHVRRMLVAAPESRFIDAFGSSELGMALFSKTSTRERIAPRRCIGRPVEIADARILDRETGAELPAGATGLLAVRSPTVTSGYWRRAEATVATWRNGYFLTGDVAFSERGDFHLVDRLVDVITTRSGPLYTLVLEEEILKVADVYDASVVGLPGEAGQESDGVFALVLAEEAQRDKRDLIGSRVWEVLLEAVQRSGVVASVVVGVARDASAFPIGPTGKVLKRRLRETFDGVRTMLAQGSLGAPTLSFLTDGVTTLTEHTRTPARSLPERERARGANPA